MGGYDKIKYFSQSLIFLAILFFNISNVSAVEISPFYTFNQAPLISIYGLPYIGEAGVAPRGEGDFRLTMDLANSYIREINSGETIELDGESLRLTLTGHYGIGSNLELGIDIPFIIVGGGFLDHFIEDYHQAFGFPNAGREDAPVNRILYKYQKNGVTLLNMQESGEGLGDIRLNGGWQIYRGADHQSNLTLRASLKLPTGDTNLLLGSGSTDLGLWMVGNLGYHVFLGQLTLFGAAGGMGMTRGKILPDQQRSMVSFGALGLGFSPVEWLAFKIQANANSPFYSDSNLKQIRYSSLQMTFGGALYFTPKTSLDIGMTEEVMVDTPDVVFHLSLQHRF